MAAPNLHVALIDAVYRLRGRTERDVRRDQRPASVQFELDGAA